MGLLEKIIKRLKLKDSVVGQSKDRDFLRLKREIEYYKNRLTVLEEALNIRVSELESRLRRLEESHNRADQIIKIIESLEPESRRN